MEVVTPPRPDEIPQSQGTELIPAGDFLLEAGLKGMEVSPLSHAIPPSPIQFEQAPDESESQVPEIEKLPDDEADEVSKAFDEVIKNLCKKEVQVDEIDRAQKPAGNQNQDRAVPPDKKSVVEKQASKSPDHISNRHEHRCESCNGCGKKVSKSHPQMWCHEKHNYKLRGRSNKRQQRFEEQQDNKESSRKRQRRTT